MRMVKNPTLPERVVALELVAAIAVSMIALYSVATRGGELS
jgi:multisubunit Na+/H+ antiporter MnhF subunit